MSDNVHKFPKKPFEVEIRESVESMVAELNRLVEQGDVEALVVVYKTKSDGWHSRMSTNEIFTELVGMMERVKYNMMRALDD